MGTNSACVGVGPPPNWKKTGMKSVGSWFARRRNAGLWFNPASIWNHHLIFWYLP
jgi:hypothetical protein